MPEGGEVEFEGVKYRIGCDPAHSDDVEITRPDGTKYTAKRLACGCVGECDPYAHDTAWDWDGRPDYE